MPSSRPPQTQTLRDKATLLRDKVESLTKLNLGLDRMTQRSKGPYHNHANSSTNQTKWSNPATGNPAKGNLAKGNPARSDPANPKASSLGGLSDGKKK
ncbi:Hypothetical predicted protein [Lecanosticta acicola]|uniref:Uncharacterized protein n=1 Tax=Lecanosticta acicola TaxID=111012 RepID=A0AAI8Z903_9PEZI|nr:Hypothetical predicted protein [Lecanosticta acicola]